MSIQINQESQRIVYKEVIVHQEPDPDDTCSFVVECLKDIPPGGYHDKSLKKVAGVIKEYLVYKTQDYHYKFYDHHNETDKMMIQKIRKDQESFAVVIDVKLVKIKSLVGWLYKAKL